MTHNESYPPCFGTIYFPTAPFSFSIDRNYLITKHCISLISAYSYLFKIFFHFSIDISCFICYIEYNK